MKSKNEHEGAGTEIKKAADRTAAVQTGGEHSVPARTDGEHGVPVQTGGERGVSAQSSGDHNAAVQADGEHNTAGQTGGDDKFIKLAVGGDAEAFGELVRHFEAFVYNVVHPITGNDEDAFDVSQETFIKAYRSIASFRGDCKFKTWLYRIAVNAARDFIRRKSRRRSVSLSDYGDGGDEAKTLDIPDENASVHPQEALEERMSREAVRAAIAHLSEDHRKIVVLRDIEGYSYEDISEMLGLEIGTVKSRLNRARASIRVYLVEHNII